jgi:SAM-dependent methyltransferase
MENYEKLNLLQKKSGSDDAHNNTRKSIHDSWLEEDTVDFWRHKRMYETMRPIALLSQNKSWLSIGDGRYGLDSYRLKKMFSVDVFPTNISEDMLAQGKQKGIISDYGVENAENLSFANESFDIVFCKEAYHHFPRPMIALYEMLRVAKDMVILIEPNDACTLDAGVLLSPRSLIRKLLKRKSYGRNYFTKPASAFEPSGNFVYSLSKNELIKVAHGLNLKGFAWKGLNDCYIQGCEFEKKNEQNAVYKKMKKEIQISDAKVKRFPMFYDWVMITAILFKSDIDSSLKQEMQAMGYQFESITPNPYL